MRNNWPIMLGCLSALLSTLPALADDSGISVGELSAVQSETYLLKAQAEREKARRSIDGESTTAAAPIQPLYQPQTDGPTYARPSVAPGLGLPVVRLISGSSQALRATLLYSGGYEVEASAKYPDLPGGYKLAKISLESVVISKAGKLYPLGFSNQAPTEAVISSGLTQQPNVIQSISAGQPAPTALPGLQ